MSAGDQLLDDLKAIAVDLAAVDRMTVELAIQEIENLRRNISDLEDGHRAILPKTRKHALDLLTVAEASLRTLT